MEFEFASDPVEFLDRTGPLLADEARHNLILGIVGSLIEDPDNYEDYRLMMVTSGGEALACGLITPPYPPVVADCPNDEALTVFVDGLVGADLDVNGVIGNKPTVDRFVEVWTHRTGDSVELAMAQGVFALEAVRPARPTRGVARLAGEKDLDRVFEWTNAFVDEAIPGEPRDDERLRQVLLKRLRREVPARVWVWEVDGSPVAMSAHSGPTGSGVRINAVYTPPAQRANGYASALVAEQSQWLLDNGHDFCFLYTDLANPTSNRIYESLGYRRVAEAASYDFSPTT